MKKIKSFTLIELMVVVLIISLLATIAVINVNTSRQRARDAKRISDINSIRDAIELYYENAGQYPPVLDSPMSALESYLKPTYLSVMPTDPNPQISGPYSGQYRYHSGAVNDYALLVTLEGQTFTLLTCGGASSTYTHSCKTGAGVVNTYSCYVWSDIAVCPF